MSKTYKNVGGTIKDIEKYIEEERKKKMKTFVGWIYYQLYLPIYRKVNDIYYFFKVNVPNFIGRIKKGYGKADVWNFDYHIASVIEGGVRELADHHMGHDATMTDEEWTEILYRISNTFATARKVANHDIILTTNQRDYRHMKKIMKNHDVVVYSPELTKDFYKGFDLFKKYFFGLWD
ncbi:MAG: hypothetical protein ACTSPD_10155 [Promethearchaeota archaeon]